MNLSEERLLVEAARKDPDKFGELFEVYYQPIFRYSLRRVADVALAQDIASRVFLKAYRKLWQFRWRGVSILAWLYRIAGNEIKSHYRKAKHEVVSVEDLKELSGWEPEDMQNVEQELVEAEEKLERHKQFLKVNQLMKNLDMKYQEVLYLRFFEDKKIREIGEVLGKKEGTVKSLLSRGLVKLRMLLREREALVRVEGLGTKEKTEDNYLYLQRRISDS